MRTSETDGSVGLDHSQFGKLRHATDYDGSPSGLANGNGRSALPKRPHGANLSVQSPIILGMPVEAPSAICTASRSGLFSRGARFLCWHFQEQAFGGLDPGTAKHLDGRARGDKRGANRPGRLKPGTLLLREYQGERHTVTVVPNGYLWREMTYASLSTIARVITGTNWNGPRFFGLRSGADATCVLEMALGSRRFVR